MCSHAQDLIELERVDASIPDSSLSSQLRAKIERSCDVEMWRQFPLALKAVRGLDKDLERYLRWASQNPRDLVEAVHSAYQNRSKRLNRDNSKAWSRIMDGVVLGHQRVQFAAGQGGFHVGGLTILAPSRANFEAWAERQELAKADFLYAYDCGSRPKKHVEVEISSFLRKSGSRRLDLLFLSHFDADHVSGVPSLIGDGKLQVETIVIPYVDDLEKVIAFARASSCGEAVDGFFRDLVVNTEETLRGLGAGRILLMENGERPAPDGPLADPMGGGPEDLPWKIAPSGDDAFEIRATGSGCFHVRNGAIEIAGAAKDGLQLAWRFIPYVQHAEESAKEKFIDIAEMLLEWDDGTFRRRISNPREREKLVTCKADVLGEAYRQTFGNKNVTSLSIYSGPANPTAAGATMILPRLKPSSLAKIGWLGTGDAPLRAAAKIDEFEDHFGEFLEAVSTFMFPHHGSIHNSDPRRLISDADIYFAAAEPGRDDWKHPAPKLKLAVEKAGKKFHHVSSARGTRLEEIMILFCLPGSAF